MKTIYLDKDFICHLNYVSGSKKYNVTFLDNVCDECVECYRYVPENEIYIIENKKIIGEFIQVIEKDKIVQLIETNVKEEKNHLNELADLIEEIYNQDMEMINNV